MAHGHDLEARPRSLEWLIPILVLFLLVAVAVAAFALSRGPSTAPLRSDISVLRADVGLLQSRVAAQQRAISSERSKVASLRKAAKRTPTPALVGRLENSVSSLTATLSMLRVCVPQLQQELAGLKVQTTNVTGWLTGASLIKPAALTPACAQALAG